MSTLASDLRTLGREAYVYLYPLVTMEVTRRQMVNSPVGSKPGFGPANAFHHMRSFPPADFRAVVRPNFDTLYSSAWLDLTAGPVLIELPDSDDRYYMMPMVDMWTDVFATLGKRTTGTGRQTVAVVGPGHRGDVPAATHVVHAPSAHLWVIGRTQTNGPADYPAVRAFQDGWRITPPAGWTAPAIDPAVDTTTEPLRLVDGLSAVEFFALATQVLLRNPPHATDASQLMRLRRLGIEPGRPFDPSRFDAAELALIQQGATDGLAEIRSGVRYAGAPVNGWLVLTTAMGVYGNEYLRRAVITLVGLGANPAQDAVYPLAQADADGQPLTGDHDYVLHFEKAELPPVHAFWSLTMYDAEGFQIPNELDRFALGDRDPLTYGADGSLDIHVGRTNPGPQLESNWLPAPAGPIGMTLRLYAPADVVLDGRWVPPAVRRVG